MFFSEGQDPLRTGVENIFRLDREINELAPLSVDKICTSATLQIQTPDKLQCVTKMICMFEFEIDMQDLYFDM